MLKGLYIMNEQSIDLVYPRDVKEEIGSLVDIISKPMTAKQVEADPSILKEIDVIFSGWGALTFTEEMLDAAPNLKAVFHAAGSIKPMISGEFFERDLIITSAAYANAIPVAEFTLAQIFFSLKNGWGFVKDLRENQHYPVKSNHHIAGAFDSTVGLISLSTIGRKVIEYLKPFDLNIIAYDPFVTDEEADQLGVEMCSLDEVFERADVVSLHSPWLPETTGMIEGSHFEKMKDQATFINTARGAIINEPEMIDVLTKRQDLSAVLDVVYPEPPATDSPLLTLPNIIVTPHIAGSEGPECGRMGTFMLGELKRYLAKEELKWQVTKKQFDSMA